jgi:hypothetical protein
MQWLRNLRERIDECSSIDLKNVKIRAGRLQRKKYVGRQEACADALRLGYRGRVLC